MNFKVPIALGAVVLFVAGVFLLGRLSEPAPQNSINEPVVASDQTLDSSAFDQPTRDENPSEDASQAAEKQFVDVEYKIGQVLATYDGFVGSKKIVDSCEIVATPGRIEGAATFINVQECEFRKEFDPPYGGMSTEELRALVPVDAKAAYVLAETLRFAGSSNTEYITTLYFHALTMSGNKDVFARLFGHENIGGRMLIRKNGSLDIGNAAQKYVWAKFGENLGFMAKDDVLFYADALASEGVVVDELSEAVESLENTMQHVASVANSGGDLK